ncbi:dihydrofolate reductase [Agromyces sp. NPDC058484]|uniref:dihydrofolate reductase n=1 Tax=Agromyces sp. NPDC058484 TaxID=3346524 RepID=UPI00366025EF
MSSGRPDAAPPPFGPAIGLVWAEARGGVIGRDGGMPWHVPEDLAHFKAVTLEAPVIMGRRTWESLPPRSRPLPGRENIVVTRNEAWAAAGAVRAASVDEALALAADGFDDRVWVIGGAELFAAVIDRADRLEVTELDLAVDGDTYAPEVDGSWRVASGDPGWRTSRGGIRYRFRRLERR